MRAEKSKGRGRTKRNRRARRNAGAYGLTIPAAGAMIGLSRSASYRAAKSGAIPTIPAGKSRIVPRLIWEEKLGVKPAADPPPASSREASAPEAASPRRDRRHNRQPEPVS
jgi:hypothetical protein